MARFIAFALVAVVPFAASVASAGAGKQEKDIKIQGKLTQNDPRDKQRNAPSQIHTVKMKSGIVYTIDMVSTDFDSYLRLEDKDGRQLAEDDDSGGNLNARIIFTCVKEGDYKIIATAFAENMVGAYTLTVKSSVNTVKTTTAHEVLTGKAAPDFAGDFAINGKPGKLSDLLGKVVLIEFWDLRSDDCMAAIGRLREWNKDFREDGLEIVTVVYYYHEIGQKLAFNKDEGKLIRTDSASKKSDQEALKQFAAHHKLEHRLMALSKEDALKAFEDYSVNGVPQAVLIDRKGIIRMIRVGDTKTAPNMESEIKKLLADK